MSSTIWTAREIARCTHAKIEKDFDIHGLEIDSRQIKSGDLFIALKDRRDGHDFVAQALAAGAIGALVSRAVEGVSSDRLILVEDVEKALYDMAVLRRHQVDAHVIAVTGSAGKTSTKEMLRHVLGHFGHVHASQKSFNNQWGVPLSLALMPKSTEYAVFEIGMNAPSEIRPLAALVEADIGVITNIAPVHLAGFIDEAAIAREKASLLYEVKQGVVNGDPSFRDILSAADKPLLFFGAHKDDDIYIHEMEISAIKSSARILLQGKDYWFELPYNGEHHLLNASAVLGVVSLLGLAVDQAIISLEGWAIPSGRGKGFDVVIEKKRLHVIDESYNANPLSMKMALRSLARYQGGRRIAVLGDMLELGPKAVDFHAQLAEEQSLEDIDGVLTVGPLMKSLDLALPKEKTIGHFEDLRSLISSYKSYLQNGDHLLIKGSNAIGLSKLVEILKETGQEGL